MLDNIKIAVLIPCFNEEIAITNVVNSFCKELPNATIYVYDNNSTDNTARAAKNAGAIVRFEAKKGKGNVVRRMFADVDADIYILVDGDSTYDATAVNGMINKLVCNQLDMVVGARLECQKDDGEAYRFGHRTGNKMFNMALARLFNSEFTDIFSGYRVFSRRFVKSFPAESQGFEIETELTIHSLELRLPCDEVPTSYISRPEGSNSKLNSYRDGIIILKKIVVLLKEVRPLFFFSCIFLFLICMSLVLFIPVLIDYLNTGLVTRFPTAILSMGVMLLAFSSLFCGIILDNVCRSKRALKRFFYLSMPLYSNDSRKHKQYSDMDILS